MRFILLLIAALSLYLLPLTSAQPPYRTSQIDTPASIYLKNPLRLDPIKPSLIIHKGIIFLDPGHGGHDIGTQSISKPRYQEKSLNLVTANFVKDYLQQLGYHIFLTRQEDVYISLDKRAQLANEQKPTIFVSIHYNSAPSSEAQGIEVYFYQSTENKSRTSKSKKLAQTILKHTIKQTQAKSRGVKHGNFAVIRETTMPAVLVEGGFMTNEEELKNLKDPSYLKRLAWGVAKGIDEYLSSIAK